MTIDLLGYDDEGNPIWAMFGADEPDSEEETEEEAEEEEEEEEEEETEESPKGKTKRQPKSAKDTEVKKAAPKKAASNYIPPSQREWERTQAALKKANETQAATRKAAIEKAKQEGMTEAAAEARTKALEEAEGTWMPRAIRAEARALLADANCKRPERLLKLIDNSKVTWDGDEPIGLESQINELKEEWPELFTADADPTPKPKKTVVPAKKIGAAAGSTKGSETDNKKTSGASRIAGRLLGASE